LRVHLLCVLNKPKRLRIVHLVGYVGPLKRPLNSSHTRKDGIFLQEIAFGADAPRHKYRIHKDLRQQVLNKSDFFLENLTWAWYNSGQMQVLTKVRRDGGLEQVRIFENYIKKGTIPKNKNGASVEGSFGNLL